MFKKVMTKLFSKEERSEPSEPAHQVFTLNWEMDLHDPATFADDLALHAAPRDQALAMGFAVEIQYDAAKTVTGTIVWEDGKPLTHPEHHIVKKWQSLVGTAFPVPETPNTLYTFFPESSSKMPHRLGGKPPSDLVIPSTRNPAGVQYVGTFTSKNGILPDWDAPLHVLSPLFVQSFSRLDLDYSDPLAPQFVDQDAFERRVELYDIDYGDIKNLEQIRYAAKYLVASSVRSRTNTARRDGIASGGAPVWVQAPAAPKCPKTGKPMRFLAQIGTFHDQNVIGKPFEALGIAYRNGFKTLNFQGSGTLYIFYQPESKIVTTFIQNT